MDITNEELKHKIMEFRKDNPSIDWLTEEQLLKRVREAAQNAGAEDDPLSDLFAKLIAVEKMIKEASAHVVAHHVSLGGSLADPNLPLPLPKGSGTFVRFRIVAGVVYGILTAAHVARWLKLGRNSQGQFVGLSKPQNGNTIACSVTFPFIYHIAPLDRFHSVSKQGYRPDIAFIALGLNQYPKHALLENSQFYDLDLTQELGFIEDPKIFSIFFRGACYEEEISADGYMDTPVCVGGGEVIKHDDESDVHYWHFPNTSKKSIAGASGAGFWRFRHEEGILRRSLEGVIIAEGEECDYIEAMGSPYLYDTLLPRLKEFCTENVAWFP